MTRCSAQLRELLRSFLVWVEHSLCGCCIPARVAGVAGHMSLGMTGKGWVRDLQEGCLCCAGMSACGADCEAVSVLELMPTYWLVKSSCSCSPVQLCVCVLACHIFIYAGAG